MTRRGDWAWKKAMKIVRAKTILGENVITDQVNAVAKGLRRERRRAVERETWEEAAKLSETFTYGTEASWLDGCERILVQAIADRCRQQAEQAGRGGGGT